MEGGAFTSLSLILITPEEHLSKQLKWTFRLLYLVSTSCLARNRSKHEGLGFADVDWDHIKRENAAEIGLASHGTEPLDAVNVNGLMATFA